MPLPVLSQSSDSLSRLFFNVQAQWLQHLAEVTELDFGLAVANSELIDVPAANCVFSASLPEGMSATQAYEQATRFFSDRSARCLRWVMKPSATGGDLGDLLLERGYSQATNQLLYLVGPLDFVEPISATILPARSAYKQAHEILQQQGTELQISKWATAELLHLDDPHTDAFIAISDRQPSAYVSMLTSGEIGVIQNLFVAPSHRVEGIGRTMIGRILELAGRAQLKHVFFPVDSGSGLKHLTGFSVIADWPTYVVTPGPRKPEA